MDINKLNNDNLCGYESPSIQPIEPKEIRWTDKVSLDNNNNIRGFNGEIIGSCVWEANDEKTDK